MKTEIKEVVDEKGVAINIYFKAIKKRKYIDIKIPFDSDLVSFLTGGEELEASLQINHGSSFKLIGSTFVNETAKNVYTKFGEVKNLKSGEIVRVTLKSSKSFPVDAFVAFKLYRKGIKNVDAKK